MTREAVHLAAPRSNVFMCAGGARSIAPPECTAGCAEQCSALQGLPEQPVNSHARFAANAMARSRQDRSLCLWLDRCRVRFVTGLLRVIHPLAPCVLQLIGPRPRASAGWLFRWGVLRAHKCGRRRRRFPHEWVPGNFSETWTYSAFLNFWLLRNWWRKHWTGGAHVPFKQPVTQKQSGRISVCYKPSKRRSVVPPSLTPRFNEGKPGDRAIISQPFSTVSALLSSSSHMETDKSVVESR